jgi:hypothetical protein
VVNRGITESNLTAPYIHSAIVPCLCTKTYGEVREELHSFLIQARGGLLNANAAFSRGKASQVPAEEEAGWVQSRSGRSEAEKTSCPAGNRSTTLRSSSPLHSHDTE